jgi:hypothetical protein
MAQTSGSANMIRSALFIDFDSIYLGLRQMDPAIADRFATDQATWLGWIESGMPSKDADPAACEPRSVLVRHCYLNPKAHHRYRSNFMQAAFATVDCPPVTRQGKTSSDIHLVLDVLDTLATYPHINEYIIFSSDSDFTPVLLRLRAQERQTAALSIGVSSPAYIAACDRVITAQMLVEDGLGMTIPAAGSAPAGEYVADGAPAEVLQPIADRVLNEVLMAGQVPATAVPGLLKEFPSFTKDSNWLGYHSLRALTMALIGLRPEMQMADGDPWVIIPASDEAADGTPRPKPLSKAELRAKIMNVIRSAVEASPEPCVMARVAHEVIEQLGDIVVQTHWAGAGTFKQFLAEEMDDSLEVALFDKPPGYIFDPSRHERPSGDRLADRFDEVTDDLRDAMRRFHDVTGAPLLAPHQYAMVMECLADHLGDGPYNFTAASKAVRDQCNERGESIARQAISFILRGLTYAGHDFDADDADNSAEHLSEVFRDNVARLCEDREVELTEDDREYLDEWLLQAAYEYVDDDEEFDDDEEDDEEDNGGEEEEES